MSNLFGWFFQILWHSQNRLTLYSTHIPRILARYQACHLISFLHKFVWLADQSQNRTQNLDFWLVGQPQIHGGNFGLIDNLTRLIPCKDSNLNYRILSWSRIIFMVYNYLSTYIALYYSQTRKSWKLLQLFLGIFSL